MKLFFLAVVAVAALFIAQVALAAQLFATYPQVDQIASWLAMRKVEIHCLDKAEAYEDPVIASGAEAYVVGWVDERGNWHPYNYAVLNEGYCELLLEVNYDPMLRGKIALAILILTHESGHLRGHKWSAFEDKTQCWTMRHFGYVAQKLGYTDPEILLSLKQYAIYWHLRLPSNYHLESCVLPLTS